MVAAAIIVVLLLLIFVVPYGVDVIYAGEVLRVGIKAGPLRIRILPKKPLTPRQEERKRRREEAKAAKKAAKKAAAEAKETAEGTEEKQTVKPKQPLELDFLLALARMGIHAIRRFFRSFTIDCFRLHYTAAAIDPYDAAMQYSYAGAAISALEPLCGDFLRVRRRDILVEVDFTTEVPRIDLRLTVSLQLFKLVHMLAAFAVEFIRWKIQKNKELKAEAAERTEDNGRE